MTYTKTTWANGDVITAQKLNNLENGVEAANNFGGAFYVTFTETDDNGTIICNKTGTEINTALNEGKVIVGIYNDYYNGSWAMSLDGNYQYINNNSYYFNFAFHYGYDSNYYLAIISLSNDTINRYEYVISTIVQQPV